MLQDPRIHRLRFRFMVAVHKDIRYAVRLARRVLDLGIRKDCPGLVEIGRILRLTLLEEVSRQVESR